MKKIFIDPLIKRKANLTKNLQVDNKGHPLPSVIEISESGTCNRKCSFCPRSDPDYKDIKEFISEKLIEKLSKELSDFNYSGIFLFSGFVEPMLDKNIYNLIKTVRNHLPLAKIEMVTNGDALNSDRIKKLFISGLNTILVSIYDSEVDAINMQRLLLDSGLKKHQFKVRHRYLSENKNFGITLSNRSGMMKNAKYPIADLNQSKNQPCYYPSYTFFMDFTGEVLICSHDWGKKLIIGNLKDKSFYDLWMDPKFMMARKRLNNSDREFSPCNNCDVVGTFMGKVHADSWKNFF